MNKQITELLNKEMDRESFLKHVGLGVLFLFGLGSIVKSLSSGEHSIVETKSSTGSNYGGGAYGK